MQVTCAYGGAAAQGGSAACARKERPQLQEAQLGVCGAEDTARADRLEDVPSSAARDNHQSPHLDHPPALDVCCAAVLVAGLRATVAEWVLFGAQRLRRLHKRAAADADSGTHASAGTLCEA
jgi:hypothetical protein